MRKKVSLGKKSVLVILVLALVLTAAAVLNSYRIYAETMDKHYQMLAVDVARTAAGLVDPGWVGTYRDEVDAIYSQNPAPVFGKEEDRAAYFSQYDSLKDQDYLAVQELLGKIKEANDVLSLYITYVDDESKTGVYLVDADSSENGCPTGQWDIIYEQNYQVFKHPETSFPAYITDTQEYGWLCSAGVAIKDADGRVVGHAMADISMEAVMNDRQDFLVHICLVMLVITTLLVLLFIGLVNRVVIKPINSLAAAAVSYVEEKKKAGGKDGRSALEKLEIHTGDEVENLCMALQQMEQDINGYIEDITAITAEKERIGAELSVATQIQASMLPCIFPAFPERSEFDIYATMTPAKEVGGDFYDFFLVDPDHLAIVIADVSGKGVPAALFMVITKTLIKNHVQMGESPGQAFTAVNQTLCENNEARLFVTAWMGILTISTGELVYTNAGHNPPLLGRAEGSFAYLKMRSGLVLAGMEGIIYREAHLKLESRDTLYLYTDGVTEATDIYEKMYGEEKLQTYLNSHQGEELESILHGIKAELDLFAKGAPQFDDITMLILRRG